MKSRLLLLTVLAFVTALLAFRINKKTTVKKIIAATINSKKNSIGCSPDWNELKDWIEEFDIPPFLGAGNYKWKISTSNDSAQFYFNQGINMYYSFHIIESMASFKKASKFDPDCGMLYWAQALAYGPNINDIGYASSPDALAASGRAIEFCNSCTEKETMLIRAQRSRYSTDSSESREKLNQVYVDLMKEVYNKYPADADVAALYADALMLQHPWDLWKNDGTPKTWEPLIQQVLEKLLAKNPNHPGANHYYIHVMEPSPYAAKALPSADRLGKLTPGLSHTVHMPSHIYLRTGNYAKGVSVNEAAVNSYKKTISLYEPVTGGAFLYIIHNLHMQTNNSMLAGRSTYSAKTAKETMKSIPADYLLTPGALGSYIQYVYMTPIFVDVRFGKWDQLLLYPKPDATQVYGNILYHFGRGMAFTQKAKTEEAKNELQQLQELMEDSSLSLPFSPFSAAIEGAVVAEGILSGTIALKEKKYNEAIDQFRLAVDAEENMVYNEPRDWMLNPKHFLGNAYIKAGQYENALKTFQKDLLNNKENGWSLFGIWQSLSAQKKIIEASKMLQRFHKAFGKSDIKLTGAVF